MKAAAEAAEMHAAHVQAARASQSASAKPVEAAATETVEAAATEAVKTTASTVEATASTVKATASTVKATASTVKAAPAKAARQSRRCAYYQGQQNSAQLTCSPHNAPHRRARLCLVVDQTPKLLIMFPIRAFDQGSIRAAGLFMSVCERVPAQVYCDKLHRDAAVQCGCALNPRYSWVNSLIPPMTLRSMRGFAVSTRDTVDRG